MSNDNLQIVILEKISEISERTARLEAEQRYVRESLDEVKRQDIVQNELLDIHIKGVQTANARLDNEIAIRKILESKVEKLEEPSKFLKILKSYILYVAAVIGAAVTIVKAFNS